MVSEHGTCTSELIPSIELKFADISWFHNRPTKPTFLPPPPREEEITTKAIEACFHVYQNLSLTSHDSRGFQLSPNGPKF